MKRRWERGSFTVEASMLMTVLLPAFVWVIYLGLYLHNQSFLQGAAYEMAAIGALYDDEKEALSAMEERKRELLENYLLKADAVQIEAKIQEEQVCVDLKGNMRMPGMAVRLFGKGETTLKAQAILERKETAKTAIKLHKGKTWKEE